MLEQIQRDLFALGARLADPGAQDRGARDEGRRSRPTTSRGSKAGSTRSSRSCRRCGASSSPADRTPGAALHVARTVCRRAERAMVALSRRRGRRSSRTLLIYVNRLSDLLFVMARRRQPARGDAGNRVVNARARGRLRLLRAAGADALRELSRRLAPAAGAHAAARRGRLRVRAPGRRHGRRRRPAGRAIASPTSTTWDALPERRGARRRPARRARTRDVFLALRAHHRRQCRLPRPLFHDLLSAFRQDVTVDALRDVGRRARLLPAFGQPGRPPGAAHRRLRSTRARCRVGRRLHGAPADELLAGSRDRLAQGAAVRAGVDLAAGRRARERPRRPAA